MSFLSVIGELLRRYAVDGLFFFLLHLVVVVLIVGSWRKIQAATAQLRQWLPEGSGSREQSEVIQILDQFVSESRELGIQGIFVPMTDFTDRLDALVDGMVTELYDRINMLLLVGIAGTLFGLFEFAYLSYTEVLREGLASGDRMAKLSAFLSQGLAKAFPVAFMGLILMLAGQTAASYPERRLRAALSGATRRALQRRQAATRAQGAVVLEAAGRIENALRPLGDLRTFLADSMKPVVDELGERLRESLHLVEIQFQELQRTTSGFSDAVATLQGTVSSLNQNTSNLEVLLRQAPEVLQRISVLQQRQENVLLQYEQSLGQSLKVSAQVMADLVSITETIKGLPATVLAATAGALQEFARESSQAMLGIVRGASERLEGEYRLLTAEVQKQVSTLQELVTGTTQALTEVGTTTHQVLQGLSEFPVQAAVHLEKAFADLGDRSAKQWLEMSQTFGGSAQTAYYQFLGNLDAHAGKVQLSLSHAADDWQRVAGSAETLIKGPLIEAMKGVRDEVSGGLREVEDWVLRRYPEVRGHVEALTANLSDLVTRVQQIQASLHDSVKAIERERASVTEWIREQAERSTRPTDGSDLASLLAEIRDRLPREGSRVGLQLAEMKDSLAQMYESLDQISQKRRSVGSSESKAKPAFFRRLFFWR